MELAQHEYWHGTQADAAVCILCEGFRVDTPFSRSRWGKHGTFGNAVYLTKSLETACLFGEYIARCCLSDATRILRLDGKYHQSIVKYLRREFGKEILTSQFDAALPANKHLTKKELISLLNFVFWRPDDNRQRLLTRWHANFTRIRAQLRRHGYHAMGHSEDMDGIAVFDPSRVICEQIYDARRLPAQASPGDLKTLELHDLATDARQWLDEEQRWAQEDPRFAYPLALVERVRENLRQLESRIGHKQ